MRAKKKQACPRQRSLLHLEMLESRRVLAAIFPAYVNGAFTLGDANSADGTPYGLSNTFNLESNPTATKTIYIDFDGHHSVNNNWGHNIVFPAYNTSGSSSTFNNAEKTEIQKIFQDMAEDFLPFDVNVTTEDPGLDALTKSNGSDQTYGIRDLHTQATGGFGNGIGGVAFLNSFNDAIDNPVFSFNKGINNGAMTGSHEVGHSLGLAHDGLNSSTYHPGTGSGETGWGPIMGAPFGKNVTQWSNGDYAGSTTTQDDVVRITRPSNGFGFRVDQYGDSIGTAHELTATGGTDIFEWGIIEERTDLDFFEFTTGAGDVSINIDPFGENPNLDIEAKLFDSSGSLIATSNGLNVVDANFNENLDAGTYFISIDGTGRDGRYSDYGSLGFYSIDATIVEGGGPVTPPVGVFGGDNVPGVVGDIGPALTTPPTNVIDAKFETLKFDGGQDDEHGHEFDVFPLAPAPGVAQGDNVVPNDVALARAHTDIETQIRDSARGRQDDRITKSIDAVFSSFGRFAS